MRFSVVLDATTATHIELIDLNGTAASPVPNETLPAGPEHLRHQRRADAGRGASGGRLPSLGEVGFSRDVRVVALDRDGTVVSTSAVTLRDGRNRVTVGAGRS